MPKSPYTTFHAPRVAASLIGGFVIVAVFALVAKRIVEGLTSFTYTIHWFETVPFLVLGTAFILNALLNERAQAGDS